MKKRMAHTLTVGAGALVSRLLGVVRDATIAWLLGGSGTADALTAALRIPYMVRRLFGEGTLSMTLTIACIQESLKNGGQASELALAVTRTLRVWGGLLTLLCVLGAGFVITATAPGLATGQVEMIGKSVGLTTDRANVFNEAVFLFRICMPYAFFAVLAAGNMAALHSREHFLLPSLTPALFNCTMLLFAGLAVFAPEAHVGTLLACGVLCGGMVQWLAQIPAVRALRRTGTVRATASSRQIHEVMRRIPGGILGAAVPQLAFLVASALASLLPEGHMSALFYAERLLEFPLGVLGAAVGMVAAPRMAVLANADTTAASVPASPTATVSGVPVSTAATSALAHETGLTLLLASGLNLPAAAGLSAVAVPLVSLVLGHGAFDSEAVTFTALALCAYAPGLPAYALSRPLLAACHAVDDTRTPLRAAVPSLLCTALAGYTLLQLPGTWGHMGPPLGVTFGLWCNAFLLWRGVKRSLPLAMPVGSLLWQLLGTVCTFAVAQYVVTSCVTHELSNFTTLAFAIPSGALGYGAILGIGMRCTKRGRLKRKAGRG